MCVFFFKSVFQFTFRHISNLYINNFSIPSVSIRNIFFLLSIFYRDDQELPWSPMTTQVRVNAENIYTEILSITRRRDRDNDIFQDNIQHSVSSGTGYVRERLERAWNNTFRRVCQSCVCMTGRLIREAIFYARKTRCEMQRDDATTTKRETNEPADARPLYLITPINPYDSVENCQFPARARCLVWNGVLLRELDRAAKRYQTWHDNGHVRLSKFGERAEVEADRVRRWKFIASRRKNEECRNVSEV